MYWSRYKTRRWDASSQSGDPVFTATSGNLLDDMLALRQKTAACACDLPAACFFSQWRRCRGCTPSRVAAHRPALPIDAGTIHGQSINSCMHVCVCVVN
jgi:hypothetical protein